MAFRSGGQALLTGTAQAAAEFRRGINLGAGFDFRGEAQVRLGNDLGAQIAAGVRLRGGIELAVFFPLDLFSEAGLIVRFRAQIEAAGFVRATLSLPFGEFRRLVGLDLPHNLLADLIGIVLDEFAFEAGLWGRVAFSFQLVAEAAITGSLLPVGGNTPGFSFSFQYGMGWFYGTGYQFITNVTIPDPHRLIDRVATELCNTAIAEAERYIAGLPPGTRSQSAAWQHCECYCHSPYALGSSSASI
jgi:hypothetical protein